ncbi:hypothetical protein E2562_000325 [Oryza meyeriana var. granulata]|uniref:Uncharacterized protein n=1 Tax=Oryza meyeriana var. granulata TaxID=110450 RepID=A0A6G1CNQ9_9ORYZ|nr:hypothetical protein E2562_000325 [Oryza meyeriana var. granulata]
MGHGQAIFTAECSHTFHLRCVPWTVCPVCAARWHDTPLVTPSAAYNDVELVEEAHAKLGDAKHHGMATAGKNNGGVLVLRRIKTRISVECLHTGVRIPAVKSGRYESRIDAEVRAAAVDVGELYADEERCFLLFLDVPRAGAMDDAATRLINVRCSYRDTATGQSVYVAGENTVVLRHLDGTGVAASMEVERERVRLQVAEDIALARAATE